MEGETEYQYLLPFASQRREKGKNLESVIVTQEYMRKPKALYALLTQILRLNIKFTLWYLISNSFILLVIKDSYLAHKEI